MLNNSEETTKGIKLLIKTLTVEAEALQLLGALAIANMADVDDEFRNTVRTLGGLKPLIQLFARTKEPEIKNIAAMAIANLSKNVQNIAVMTTLGVVPHLVQALRDESGTEETKQQAAFALTNLAMVDENKEKVRTLAGIEALGPVDICPHRRRAAA